MIIRIKDWSKRLKIKISYKVVISILEAVTLKEKKLSVVKFKEQMEKLN